jgi:hypothetical protein
VGNGTPHQQPPARSRLSRRFFLATLTMALVDAYTIRVLNGRIPAATESTPFTWE